MHRCLFLSLEAVLALRHQPEFWTDGPIGQESSHLFRHEPDVSTFPLFTEMPIDHFAENPDATWLYKHFVVDAYFKEGGALVLNMPGEGATGGCRASEMVKRLGALAVCSEHRFFGTSVPRNSSTVADFQHLSVEQNLADQVALASHIRSKYPTISKVVSYGGSYPGSSSAWIRDQYPENIDASIAESPPLVARMDFSEYDVSNLVALASPDARCANTLASVNEAVDRQMRENRSALFSLFKADYQITSVLGDSDFIYGIGDITAFFVQYGVKARICKALSPFYDMVAVHDFEYTEFLAEFMFLSLGRDYFKGCAYNSTCMRESEFDYPAQAQRSWFWLTCTQLGWFQIAPTTGLATRPRAYDLAKALEQCAYIYPGAKLVSEESIAAFNNKYGGATMGARSKIFELDYSDDPWAVITSVPMVQRREVPLTVDQPFLYLTCDGCGHCGAGVSEEKLAVINDQKIYFLRKWGIPVLGEPSAAIV